MGYDVTIILHPRGDPGLGMLYRDRNRGMGEMLEREEIEEFGIRLLRC